MRLVRALEWIVVASVGLLLVLLFATMWDEATCAEWGPPHDELVIGTDGQSFVVVTSRDCARRRR